MPVSKAKKQTILQELQDLVSRQKAVVFADFAGVKTSDLNALKKQLQKVNSVLRVSKKTLLELAFKNKHGADLGAKVRGLKGQVAAIIGLADEVQPAKLAYQFAKANDKFKLLGGVVNQQFVELAMIEQLALLPSPLELKARFVGAIAGPLTGLVCLMNNQLSQLVYVLDALKTKRAQTT